MFHFLFSPIGLLTVAGGAWLYRKYGNQVGKTLADRVADSSLPGKLGLRIERQTADESAEPVTKPKAGKRSAKPRETEARL